MHIALLIAAVVFAAFCVWLTVRIINRRERWAKWTAVALIVLSASLTSWWWTRAREGILYDPIDMQAGLSGY